MSRLGFEALEEVRSKARAQTNKSPTPRKRGRPRSVPDGAYLRSHLATDEEHAAIVALLKRLRARKPRP